MTIQLCKTYNRPDTKGRRTSVSMCTINGRENWINWRLLLWYLIK